MVQVYADSLLVYDSRVPATSLLELSYTAGLNKSGTATISLAPGHHAYNEFVSCRTIVTIYRDDLLLFRGRALHPQDDLYKRRTITCEGERGFFLDSVSRPYAYQGSPEEIFAALIAEHNTQVEAEKQFQVGTVTVTDANDYISMESSKAEQIADTLNKLVERCGGYIVFTTNTEGQRVANWYAEMGYRSRQTIELGANLLDYAQADNVDALATRIIPYGAEVDETGGRLTIESVNDGLDYIQDDEAVALRGVIAKPVYWDDVTVAANLLTKAKKYLANSRNIISTLELSALDLSLLDKSIDTFQVGDLVRVTSRPHGVDEDFLLTDRSEDLLHPGKSAVSFGKERATLTGLDTAGEKGNNSKLQQVEREIKADYTTGIAAAVQEAKATLSSLIEQTSEAIRLEVSETYTTGEELDRMVQTTFEQLADSFEMRFTSLQTTVDETDAEHRQRFETIEKYIRFEDGNIILGETGNELTLHIQNDRISFLDGGAEVAYISNKQLYILDGHFLNSLRVGSFAYVPRENGNLSLVKVGD